MPPRQAARIVEGRPGPPHLLPLLRRISAGTDPETEPDTETVAAARLTMIRVLLTTLGTRVDLEYAMTLPGIFPPE
ncbi:hypothetical protein ACLMAJ_04820 [Nocardia sp. KC 131]|uniref:hypothetical protein n=1 Tax=Nocardia arseniciresistens TaxID=3392119 RepID=UPI00398E9DF8